MESGDKQYRILVGKQLKIVRLKGCSMLAVTVGDKKGTQSFGVEASQNLFSYKTEEIKG
jgi:hypothetical protein